jgi:surfactin synthase thioesterase subunit
VEQYYLLGRKSEEIEMARCATSPEARLVHQELATRYGAKAKAAETDALAAFGIAKVRADQYLVNGYRYTTAGDALAEAKRGLAQ